MAAEEYWRGEDPPQAPPETPPRFEPEEGESRMQMMGGQVDMTPPKYLRAYQVLLAGIFMILAAVMLLGAIYAVVLLLQGKWWETVVQLGYVFWVYLLATVVGDRFRKSRSPLVIEAWNWGVKSHETRIKTDGSFWSTDMPEAER